MLLSSAWKMRCFPSICNSYTRNFQTVGRLYRLLIVQRIRLEHSKLSTKGLTTGPSDKVCDSEPHVKDGDPNSSDLIEVQKGRAIVQWEEAHAKKYFEKDVYENVLDDLKKGKVCPIFHTLCREPAKRLFLPNTVVSNGDIHSGKIEVSANPVEAGFAKQESKVSTTKAVSDDNNEGSYLRAFFAKDGKPVFNVLDSVVGKEWKFDEKITNIVTDLVNVKATMVGHDLEVTKLPAEFPLDHFNGKNLITRGLSRGVVADCFEQSKPGSTYAIVGSPGIGKSWSLIYALQQALLFENSCVMFCFQKLGICWVCIRKDHHIYAWEIEFLLFFQNNFASDLFKNGNVLALLDPRESDNNGGAAFLTGNFRRLIYAASNNKSHFSSLVGKNTGHAKRVLNPFTDNEVKIALPFMVNMETDMERCTDVIMERAKVVGNLPRYLIDDTMFDDRKKEQTEFITRVTRRKVDLESVLFWNGMSEKKGSVPGTAFAVYIRETNFYDGNPEDVGYDGNLINNYWDMAISPLTPIVRGELLKKWRKQILSYYKISGSEDHGEMGLAVEDLFWEDLKTGVIMKCWKMDYGKKSSIFLLFNTASGAFYDFDIHDEENSFSSAKQDLPPCTIITNAKIQDLATKVFFSEKRTVCRMVKCGKTIDAAKNGNNVFQVKVNSKHEFIFNGIKDLLIAAGYLKMGENGLCERSCAGIEELHYFWVVPYSNRHAWQRKRQVQKLLYDKEEPEDYDIVFACFQEKVKEFILFIENEPHYNN